MKQKISAFLLSLAVVLSSIPLVKAGETGSVLVPISVDQAWLYRASIDAYPGLPASARTMLKAVDLQNPEQRALFTPIVQAVAQLQAEGASDDDESVLYKRVAKLIEKESRAAISAANDEAAGAAQLRQSQGKIDALLRLASIYELSDLKNNLEAVSQGLPERIRLAIARIMTDDANALAPQPHQSLQDLMGGLKTTAAREKIGVKITARVHPQDGFTGISLAFDNRAQFKRADRLIELIFSHPAAANVQFGQSPRSRKFMLYVQNETAEARRLAGEAQGRMQMRAEDAMVNGAPGLAFGGISRVFALLDASAIDQAMRQALAKGTAEKYFYRKNSRVRKMAVQILAPIDKAAARLAHYSSYNLNPNGSTLLVELTGTRDQVADALKGANVKMAWLGSDAESLPGNRLYMRDDGAYENAARGVSTVYLRRGSGFGYQTGPGKIAHGPRENEVNLLVDFESVAEMPYSEVSQDIFDGLDPGLTSDQMRKSMESYYPPRPEKSDAGFKPSDIVTVIRYRRR